eukprot:2884510-Alexandrium_andersonii.AAC.1
MEGYAAPRGCTASREERPQSQASCAALRPAPGQASARVRGPQRARLRPWLKPCRSTCSVRAEPD